MPMGKAMSPLHRAGTLNERQDHVSIPAIPVRSNVRVVAVAQVFVQWYDSDATHSVGGIAIPSSRELPPTAICKGVLDAIYTKTGQPDACVSDAGGVRFGRADGNPRADHHHCVADTAGFAADGSPAVYTAW